jgi:site-specific DNA-methyltransferase (adenine-specific)
MDDCLKILPEVGPVDTVIIDPVWPNVPDGMFPGVDCPQILLASALEMIEAKRVVIVLRSDSDPRFLDAVPKRWPFFRVQVLPYVLPGYYGRVLGGDEL